ncbi:MAG TPA: hypothetical protein VK995_01690, partial [Oceanipulchritudo sp.]|nr:hypothetical protein [Oceanipulchritudo sp.]
VIAIHSYNYRPQEAYNAVVIAKGSHAGSADEVCIIAPQFLETSALPASIPDNLLYWGSFPFRGTSSGRFGPNEQRVTISVFDVLDRIMETVTDPALFPNLETIVVLGHSAGGQLVNRYAIAGRFEETLAPERNIHLRYLVLAPSSFLYFTPARDPDGDGVFEIPSAGDLAACPQYDDYGYGMQALYNYPAATGLEAMLEQYPRRFVFYMVGALDNDPEDSSLGTGCDSMAQGNQRLARSTIYFNHLLDVFGPEILDRQTFSIIPGVGHSYTGQLNTDTGRRYLSDRDPADTDGDGQSDWAEWIGGTDALDADDTFQTAWQAPSLSAAFQMNWPAMPGRRYRILEADSPEGPFTEAEMVRPEPGEETVSWVIAPGSDPHFLKIQAELD